MTKEDLAVFKKEKFSEFKKYKEDGKLRKWLLDNVSKHIIMKDDDYDFVESVIELIMNQLCLDIDVGEGFIDAFLANDLWDATGLADKQTRVLLSVYTLYIKNMVPHIIVDNYRKDLVVK